MSVLIGAKVTLLISPGCIVMPGTDLTYSYTVLVFYLPVSIVKVLVVIAAGGLAT